MDTNKKERNVAFAKEELLDAKKDRLNSEVIGNLRGSNLLYFY